MTGPGSFPSPSQSNQRELPWVRSLSPTARSSLPTPHRHHTGGHRGTWEPPPAPLCPYFTQKDGGKRPESARAPPPSCPRRCSLDPLASSPRNPRSPRGARGSALMPRAGRRPPGTSPGYTTRHRAAHGHRMPGRSSRPWPWGTLILGSPNPALVLHPFLLPFPARSRQESQRPVPKGLAGCPAQQHSPPAPSAQGINFGL